MTTTHASFDFATLPTADSYKLLASTVMPRPIGWITTLAENGTVNAAPFSFFNVVCADPPLLIVSFATAPDRDGKDTLANIRATGEFVVHMVSRGLAEAMNITATNAPRGTDETKLAGLTLTPSVEVKVPRITEAPVAYECRHFQTIETGGVSTLLLGRVVYGYVLEEAFVDREQLYLDPAKLDLIGRMHGAGGYCTTRDLFHIDRLSWPLET